MAVEMSSLRINRTLGKAESEKERDWILMTLLHALIKLFLNLSFLLCVCFLNRGWQ